MCIKIVGSIEETSYDVNKPLEDQLKGAKRVVVNYEPKDFDTVEHFLDEMERLCKSGISAKINLQFNHNYNIKGAKVQKEMKSLSKDLDLNEVIKLMTLVQSETDKKLEEMSELCLKR